MKRVCLLACIVMAHAALPEARAQAPPKGKKYALLVGVTEYKHGGLTPLRFTENDVEGVAAALRRPGAGFSEIRVLSVSRGAKNKADSPTAENIEAALKKLLAGKTRHDTILIGLAGHGLTLDVPDPDLKAASRSYGYFCPVDADLNTKPSFSTGKAESLLALDRFFGDIKGCGAGTKLVLIDACRNDLEAKGSTRSVSPGQFEIPDRVGALFSCGRGERAWESPKLGKGHGVFFYHVIEALNGAAKNEEGDVGWDDLTSFVRRNVAKKVPEIIGGKATQVPHSVANLEGLAIVVAKSSAEDVLFARGMELVQGTGPDGTYDQRKALECFRKAAEKGHPLSQAAQAWSHNWFEPDAKEAERLAALSFEKIKPLAEAGNPDAQYLVGRLLRGGLSVTQDYDEAATWFRKAVDKGQPHAMVELAFMYGIGKGVEKDSAEGFRLFKRAGDLGSATALEFVGRGYLLGSGVEKDPIEAAKAFRRGADKNESSCLFYMGYLHERGIGVEQSFDKAREYWTKSAGLGHALAMSYLGWLYNNGKGVDVDTKVAADWYLKAAQKNDLIAQYMLGLFYANGRGVEKDKDEAIKWLKKAADRGHKEAKEKLAELSE